MLLLVHDEASKLWVCPDCFDASLAFDRPALMMIEGPLAALECEGPDHDKRAARAVIKRTAASEAARSC